MSILNMLKERVLNKFLPSSLSNQRGLNKYANLKTLETLETVSPRFFPTINDIRTLTIIETAGPRFIPTLTTFENLKSIKKSIKDKENKQKNIFFEKKSYVSKNKTKIDNSLNDKSSLGKKILLGTLAAPIPTIAENTTINYIVPHIVKSSFDKDVIVESSLLEKIFNNIKNKYNLNTQYLDINEVLPFFKNNAFYDVESNEVVATKKFLGLDIHEMGHAIDLKNSAGKPLTPVSRLLYSRHLPKGIAAVGALAATSDNEKVRKWAVPVSVLGYAPLLRREAAANLKGYYALKDYIKENPMRFKNSEDILKKVRGVLAKSFSTYLLPPLAMGSTVWLIKKYKDNEDSIHNKFKNLFKEK